MNAANRPIDFLLNTESVKVSQSQRREVGRESSRNSDVSHSKTRGKSFDDVYRQQRREDAEVRQTSRSARGNESQNRAENRTDSSQQQSKLASHSAADKRAQKDAQGVTSGKALPSENASVAADTESRAVEEGVIDAESLAVDLSQDVEVTVSFDTQILNTQELSQQALGLQEVNPQELDQVELDKLESSLSEDGVAEVDEQVVVSFDSSTLTDSEVLEDVEQPELGLAQQTVDDESAEQALKQPVNETINLQTQQTAQEQQSRVATPEMVKELKQSVVGDEADNGSKNSVSATPISKTDTTGIEQRGQVQMQDRFSSLPLGQEFKLLREQLSTENLNIAADKGASVEASASTDSAADGLPRLNALTQSAQALGLARAGTVTASVQTPVNSADWGQAMSQRIVWLASRGISAAELQLNPRDLGPVDVRININGDQAHVQFTSQHAAVREALESSVVRLREMMESSGLNLADVNVSDQSHSEQAQSDSRGSSGTASANENDELNEGLETQTVQRIESDGLVDFYA